MLPCTGCETASVGLPRGWKMASLGGSLSEKHTPESWVGQDVMVARSSATEAELVRLEGISDWGVVCVYKDAEVVEPVLLPWNSLSWVRLAVQEEVEVLNGGSGESGRSEG